MKPDRPDDSDLTQKLWRLREPQPEPAVWIGILMFGVIFTLPMGALFVFLCWLGKQLL